MFNKVIRWLKIYCLRKGLSSLDIKITRKNNAGPDDYEVSIKRQSLPTTLSETARTRFNKKRKSPKLSPGLKIKLFKT